MKKSPDSPAYLYVMGDSDGPQKIGVTCNLQSRRQVVQVSSLNRLQEPFALQMPRKTAFAAERYAHWLLRARRVRGEWYRVTPKEAIAAVRRAHRAALAGWT